MSVITHLIGKSTTYWPIKRWIDQSGDIGSCVAGLANIRDWSMRGNRTTIGLAPACLSYVKMKARPSSCKLSKIDEKSTDIQAESE